MAPIESTDFELDKEYYTAKAVDSKVTFSRLEWSRVAHRLRNGEPHETLGNVLKSGAPWEKAGAAKYRALKSILKLSRGERLLDYGCGTLRLGIHFIKFLRPFGYMGLDIIPDFIEKGQSLLGSRLLAKKCPKLLVIDESSISTGERFMADAVVSSDVAFHIHPDEAPGYFAILSRLTGKKGARLVFDAKTSERPYRYNESGWAWPVDHYVQFLRPLELVSIHHQQTYYYDAACSTGYFEFRRV